MSSERAKRRAISVRKNTQKKRRVRRLREALQQSEERYKLLFNSGYDAIMVHEYTDDYNLTQFLEVNDVACEMLGYSRQQLLQMNPQQIVDAACWKDAEKIREIILKEKHALFEWTAITRDGRKIPVEINTHLFELNERPTLLSIARDVTQRKSIEEALRQSGERYKLMFESSYDAVMIYGLSKESFPGKLLEANKVACTILGYSRDELLSLSLPNLIAPEFRQESGEHMEKLLIQKRGLFETELLTKKKQQIPAEVSAHLFNLSGEPAVLLIARDSSARKHAEKVQSAIYRISEAAYSASSLEQLLPAIHSIVNELMPAKNLFISLYDEQTGILSFPYFVDEYNEPEPARKQGKGMTEYVLRTGEPLLAPLRKIRELYQQGEIELLGTIPIDWLGVPLKTKDHTIGVLSIQSYTEGVRFGEEEQNILMFVSTQIAAAIERKRAEEALRKSDERYRALIRQSSEGIWRTEFEVPIPVSLPEEEQIAKLYGQGYVAECNDVMAQMYGLNKAEDLIGLKLERMLLRSDSDNKNYLRRFIRNGYRLIDAESHEIDLSGRPRYFLNNIAGIVENGHLTRVWGHLREVTERKRAEEAMRASEARYRLLFERNLAGVFRTTVDGEFIDCNDSFARILGFDSREELLAHRSWDFYPASGDRDSFIFRLRENQALTNYEIRLKRRDGKLIWALENASLIQDESGYASLIEGTLIDITDRKSAEEQIAYQAYHDALTGLPNRNLLRDRLNQALAHSVREGEGLAILFLDLDHFKLINDTMGHSVGDWLLRDVAERLKKSVREGDTVARLGGDEFVLLLPGVQISENAARIAQKILDVIDLPMQYQNHELFITTSIGISLCPNDGKDAETLLKSADNAMYRAKELGRNMYQLSSPALNERAQIRLSMERDLRRAVDRNEFVLYYQPQFELNTGTITGVEALIRWMHPEKGMIMPLDFIPLAEETRLIAPIGQWILKTACEQIRSWRLQGASLRLSVNLSAKQFQQHNLVHQIETTLAQTGMPSEELVIEITESVAMQNMDLTLAVLHTLRKKQIQIALDDFGVGYSSLSYLKHFPIDIIKIDPSFIRDLGTGMQEESLVRAVIQLGHSLDRRVIAEGVETESQREFLLHEGCEEIQGFLMCHPLPPDQLEPLLLAAMSEKR